MPEPVERGEEWLIAQVAAALDGAVTDYQIAKFYGLEEGEPVEAVHREAYAKKRARVAEIAGKVMDSAARQADAARRAAMIAEAGFLLEKWAD